MHPIVVHAVFAL